MRTLGRAAEGLFCLVVALGCAAESYAAALDQAGEMRLGLRTYTAARIGTEATDVFIRKDPTGRQVSRSVTFPVSPAGHLRQSRLFAEVDLNHDLDRLVREGFGPFALLDPLPFKVRRLSYRLTYRGEYEGIYDYGPSEFRTANGYDDTEIVRPDLATGAPIDPGPKRRHLRRVASQRHRLFQAYVQAQAGDLWMRFGRQILAWGETDAFRLLDNINPLDASFGGFLIPLDERRVPLDMLRANYYLSELPGLPISAIELEGYGAIDDEVGFIPGTPAGSPWGVPNLNVPSTLVFTESRPPQRNFADLRGGFRVKFTAPVPGIHSADLSVAHYWTYFDPPQVEVFARGDFPNSFRDGPAAGHFSAALQTAARVQVTGATATFAIPPQWVRPVGLSGEPIVRLEIAHFRGEPRFTQAQLDPFIFALDNCARGHHIGQYCSGGTRTGHSWNFAAGVDLHQWIRPLNRNATFFFTTQFFYKHLADAAERRRVRAPLPPFCFRFENGVCVDSQPELFDGEILPAVRSIEAPDRWVGPVLAASEPVFTTTPTDQFLQTLAISSTYFSGRIEPVFGLFYDWNGALVLQPSVTFVRDPFRFVMSYSRLEAGALRGGSGISLLRDRDNVHVQLEYTI